MAWQEKSIYGDGAKGHHRFTLKIIEDSTSTVTNKSYIRWEFILSPTVNWYDWEYLNQVPVNYIVNINGERYDGNIMTYDGISTVVVRSGSMYVDHNSDGSKRIGFNFSVWSLDVYYLPGAASASGYMDLTYIPRHAKIISAPNITDEDTPTISYSNPAGDAVDELKACIAYWVNDSQLLYASYRNLDPYASTYTFDTGFDKDLLYRSFPNTKGPITVTFYVTSTIGGITEYRTLDRELRIVNADPIITSTSVIDLGSSSTAVTKNEDVVISGHNYMQCSLAVTGNKYATITRKYVTCGSDRADIQDGYGIIQNAKSGDFIFTVEDSRGNVSSVPVTKEFVPYVPLSCDLVADMHYVENDIADASLSIKCNYYSGDFGSSNSSKNTIKLYYRYKKIGGEYTNWLPGTDEPVIQGSILTSVEVVPGLDYNATYRFQVKATDTINSEGVYSAEYVTNAVPVFDYGRDDFNFNVPVWIKGYRVMTHNIHDRMTRAFTRETVSYAANSYIKLRRADSSSEFRNDNVAIFNDDGTITVRKDMDALVNIHISGANPSGRSWIRLKDYIDGWDYTQAINYGAYTTTTISMIVHLREDCPIGVVTVEPLDMNSSGVTGSYIEIIEL